MGVTTATSASGATACTTTKLVPMEPKETVTTTAVVDITIAEGMATEVVNRYFQMVEATVMVMPVIAAVALAVAEVALVTKVAAVSMLATET
ncbi:hypothetical protein FGB62_57g11 [Gracilaria domingensis]|nr:hypothetical protein FGB62_57g11 [Gracilaria domingensis]